MINGRLVSLVFQIKPINDGCLVPSEGLLSVISGREETQWPCSIVFFNYHSLGKITGVNANCFVFGNVRLNEV